MIVIGIDSHKRTHTAVAVDGNGRKLGEVTLGTTSAGHLDLVRWAARFPGHRFALENLPGTVARIARELVGRIRDLTRTIDALEREITRLVREVAPTLLALPGCGPLSAGKLVGQVARAGRFRSAAAFARHDGSAPLPVWSGNHERHRLSRKGDRQVNVALHRIAITQIRMDERGRAYYEHRRAAGDTKTEAIRALKRRISDEIYRRMRHDERLRATPRAALAAAA